MTTQNETWEELIAKSDTDIAPDTFAKEGEIIHKPTDDVPHAMRISSLEYKGYKQIWDRRTGVMSLQPHYLVPQALSKRHPDGSRVFTTVDPKKATNYGEDIPCLLHPSNPAWPEYQRMGFAPCNKAHLRHEDAQLAHMRKSHKRAYEAVTNNRQRSERAEDRELQRQMMASIAALSQNRAETSTPQPQATAPKAVVLPKSGACPECGQTKKNLRSHYRMAHHG